MKYFVYIIYSPSGDTYYIGHTDNIERRLIQHRNHKNISTKVFNDWELKYTERFNSRAEAMKREKEIKAKERRAYIEWLIEKLA